MISILISSERVNQAEKVFKLLEDEELVITFNILEEAAYVGLSAIYGCRGYKLRDKVRKGLSDEARAFLDGLRSFIEEFQIRMILPPRDPIMLLDIIINYRLMPADAAIAASCKCHGITKIATLDADFKRVDFLEVIDA